MKLFLTQHKRLNIVGSKIAASKIEHKYTISKTFFTLKKFENALVGN